MNIKEEAMAMLEQMRGVVYSPGFGAGFTSWETNIPPHDQTLVRMILERGTVTEVWENVETAVVSITKKKLEEILHELGYSYLGSSFSDKLLLLHVRFLPAGTMFRIHEYDGSESVEIFDPSSYYVL